jgi:integrase
MKVIQMPAREVPAWPESNPLIETSPKSEPLLSDLMRAASMRKALFKDAAIAWLETRREHLCPITFTDYRYYIKELSTFFGEMKLEEITGDHLRAYQRERRKAAGASLINKELGIINMMRDRIGVPLADYQRLKQPKDWESPGRALTESEEETVKKVCQIVAEHPKWQTAALAALLSMSSGMTRREILSLKLKDCFLENSSNSYIMIPRLGAKRVSRERRVQLAETGTWCLEQLINRAMKKCGCTDGNHFLFPFQNKDHSYDPTRPGRGYRTGMRHVFELTGLKNFTPHSFRHHAVSRALSNPEVPLQGAVRHFGWINPKMVNRYYHESVKESSIVARAIEARRSVDSETRSWRPRKPRLLERLRPDMD